MKLDITSSLEWTDTSKLVLPLWIVHNNIVLADTSKWFFPLQTHQIGLVVIDISQWPCPNKPLP